MPVPGRLGRLPNDPTRPRLRLAAHLTGAVPPDPASADYLSQITQWPMYANDRLGDCVLAACGHLIMAITAYGAGALVKVTDRDVVSAYSAITGYDPKDPSTDQGTVIQDALDYWRKTGIAGHKIVAFAQVDHHNPTEVDAAINLFGALMVGVNLPQSAMDQFNQGKPWSSVGPDGGILGGHAVHTGAFSTPGRSTRAVTWGAVVDVQDAWWNRYVEECWAVLSPQWVSAAGLSPTGLNLHSLGQDFAELTGQPNPFPDPTPPLADADHTFAAQLHAWLGHRHIGMNHQLALEAKTWLAVKGL